MPPIFSPKTHLLTQWGSTTMLPLEYVEGEFCRNQEPPVDQGPLCGKVILYRTRELFHIITSLRLLGSSNFLSHSLKRSFQKCWPSPVTYGSLRFLLFPGNARGQRFLLLLQVSAWEERGTGVSYQGVKQNFDLDCHQRLSHSLAALLR